MSLIKPTTSASVSMIFINKAVIMQCPHSMPFLTLPLGTEDFQQQKQVANSSLIHCGIQNGTQQSQRNRFGHFKKSFSAFPSSTMLMLYLFVQG
ncbi:unnamed protein product [Brassica oleracea var. botrytis]